MPSADQLHVLEDLADDKCDAALRALAAARQALAAAREQLAVLTRYGEDYHTRLGREAEGGIESDMLRNYQAFMTKVAQAIAAQRLEVDRRASQCTAAERQWHEAQRQRDSYRTLAAREDSRQRQIAERREQKTNDESAARMAPFGVRTII